MGSTERIAPARDFCTLAEYRDKDGNAGGYDVLLDPAPKAFQINEDKRFRVVTNAGRTRDFPSGSFTTKIIYPAQVQRIKSGTEVGVHAIILYFD